jgi:hypothetical protein
MKSVDLGRSKILRSVRDMEIFVELVGLQDNPKLSISPYYGDWERAKKMTVQILSALVKDIPMEFGHGEFKEYAIKVSKTTKLHYESYSDNSTIGDLWMWLIAIPKFVGILFGIKWKINVQGNTMIENPEKWVGLRRGFTLESSLKGHK